MYKNIYQDQVSGERLQDHRSSGTSFSHQSALYGLSLTSVNFIWFEPKISLRCSHEETLGP